MKLLFDQNLSPRLVERLTDLYPGSAHVYSVGLDRAPDLAVWSFARAHGYSIVTRDSDFPDLATLFGLPPHIVWIRRGNCSSQEIESILRSHYEAIADLSLGRSSGILALF